MQRLWEILLYFTTCTGIAAVGSNASVEQIQQKNIELLMESLQQGWKKFCETPVDEGVMSLYAGISPSDTSLHVVTWNNQSVELPIRALTELREFDINPKRKTLLYINGFYAADSYFSIQAHLQMLQMKRRDLNVIVMDFAKSIQQLYYAVRHHMVLQAYFVAKILTVLIQNGIHPQDITVAGHSVGANIAALGISTFTAESPKLSAISQLIAIDPSCHICNGNGFDVQRNLTTRVVVIHGEGNVFGVRQPLGTLDIYPNGIGYFPKRRLQPGCVNSLCSHMYPFLLFMEALVEQVRIPAVQCTSWLKFREQKCDFANTVDVGINYANTAKGLYFCMTQAYPPFTLHELGLRYTSRSKRQFF